MKGLIISGGSIKSYDLLRELIVGVDFILCADGGIRHTIPIGIIPNAVIGDLDSTTSIELDYINKNSIPVIKYPVEKDETDTELAIDYLIKKGFKDISLLAVTGTRMDHTLGNIFLLNKLRINNIDGRIIDDNNIIYMTNNKLTLRKKEDFFVSIIPINYDGVEVSLKGFYYPLNKEKIQFGSTLGISNRIVEDEGIIDIIDGLALIIQSND